MASHAQGRASLDAAWRTLFGTAPTRREMQLVGAVASLESGYGDGVYRRLSIPDGAVLEEFRGTNNWGALQCCMPDPDGACPGNTFPTTDKSPQKVTPENPMGYYDACFRRFATAAEGARAFLQVMLLQKGREPVRAALPSGSATTVAKAMHATHYEEATVESYARSIQLNASAIAASLREPLEVHLVEIPAPVFLPPGPFPKPVLPKAPNETKSNLLPWVGLAATCWYFSRKNGLR